MARTSFVSIALPGNVYARKRHRENITVKRQTPNAIIYLGFHAGYSHILVHSVINLRDQPRIMSRKINIFI